MITTKQPKDLDEAVELILADISNNQGSIDFMEETSEDDFIAQLHMFYGRGIRNSWFLWWSADHNYDTWPKEKPKLVEFFHDNQIFHADDMSSIILTTVYRKYYNHPVDLEGQVKHYHDYWLEACGNINPLTK